MTVKVFTQEEVDAILPDKNGKRYFPVGDYSLVKKFGVLCIFGESCIFGSDCSFGDLNIFGHCCIFGSCCSFGYNCSFGEGCCFNDLRFFEGSFKAKTNLPFIALADHGSDVEVSYFFDFKEGNYIRDWMSLWNSGEFKTKVLEDEKTPATPSDELKLT